jgi:hypothetical protein
MRETPQWILAELHPIFHRLFHFYDTKLTMEIEPHKLLESMITVKENHISSQFYLRNYDRKRRRIMGLFLNTQHWDSCTNAAVKRALVQGALCRILRFSDADASVVLPVVAHWATELRAHGYPAAVMHQAILQI